MIVAGKLEDGILQNYLESDRFYIFDSKNELMISFSIQKFKSTFP